MNLNKIPSYDCFVCCRRRRRKYGFGYTLACKCIFMYVWWIGCDLFYRNFIHNSKMSTYNTRNMVYIYWRKKATHIYGTFIVIQSNWNKPKKKTTWFFFVYSIKFQLKKKSNNNNAKIKYIDETHSIQSIYVKMFEPLKYYNVFFSLDWGKIYNMLQINTQNVYATLCGKKRIKWRRTFTRFI